MRVFYWTKPLAEHGRRFYQCDSESNYAAEVPPYQVNPDTLHTMLEAGFIEISSDTAYKLGLPT